MICDTQRAKEVARRIDRATMVFDDDTSWVDSNLDEIYQTIETLRQQVQRYDGNE